MNDINFSSGRKLATPLAVKMEQTGEVLKVSGVLAYPGTFTGMDGIPTTFTKESLRRIYESAKGSNAKYFLTHIHTDQGDHRGYNYKLGFNDDTGEIVHEGLVFDKIAQDRITKYGYTYVSGEFENVKLDPSSTSSHHIVSNAILPAIAFVRDPGIPGTNMDVSAVRFQKYGGKYMTNIDELKKILMSKGLKAEDLPEIGDVVVKMMEAATTSGTPPTSTGPSTGPEVLALQSAVEQMGTTVKALQADVLAANKTVELVNTQLAAAQTEKFEAIKANLTRLGIEHPETLVDGLPIAQQIGLLQKVGERVAMSAPLIKQPTNMVVDKKMGASAYDEVVRELGIESLAKEFAPMVGA